MQKIEDLFCPDFGKYYKNVSILNVKERARASSNIEGELIAIEPNDTICEYNYFRKIGETQIRELDNGGSEFDLQLIERFNWVYFNKVKVDSYKIINQFKSLLKGLDVSIVRVIDNENEVYKTECNGTMKIEYKNVTFISIEILFTQNQENNCLNECI